MFFRDFVIKGIELLSAVRAVPVIIFLTVLVGVSGISFQVISAALAGETNLDILTDMFVSCERHKLKVGNGEKVILRVDDIQAHLFVDASAKIMQEASARSIPLVLGVIPNNLEEDKKIYYMLRQNRCNFEIALHGWDHNTGEDGMIGEFSNLGTDEAYQRILIGKPVLEELYEEPILTFIPPNNSISDDARVAVSMAGMQIVSSMGGREFDYDSATYDFDERKLLLTEETIGDCEPSFKNNETCIIMIHPQDYMVENRLDAEKYQKYIDLLDALENRGVTFLRFKDIHAQKDAEEYFHYVSLETDIAELGLNEGEDMNIFDLDEIEHIQLDWRSREVISILRRFVENNRL